MCKIGIMLGTAGENLPSAILFMNSNKSEKNIRKKVAKTREKCPSHGIILGRDVVICKGPDRDVDRDAVNLLISLKRKTFPLMYSYRHTGQRDWNSTA